MMKINTHKDQFANNVHRLYDKYSTNKCNVHLMEMFGNCEFNPEEDRHKVEIWLQENGWIKHHLNFRGTCWIKENFQFIVDYGGIAIRTTDDIVHETRVRTKEQLQDILAPYHLPAWLIEEFTIKLKPIIKKTEKEDTLPYVLQTEM